MFSVDLHQHGFHRPDSGVGLSEIAQAHLKSMRTITDEMDIFTCKPHNDLLSNREDNGAYTIANPGREYAVYFPKGGTVDLNLSAGKSTDAKTVTIRWLNIRKSEWKKQEETPFSESITLSAPTEAHWVVLIQSK